MAYNWTQADEPKLSDLVKCVVRLKQPDDALPIAQRMIAEDCSAWHASALYYGSKCFCAACDKTLVATFYLPKRPRWR